MDSDVHRREHLEEAPTQREDANKTMEAETGVMLPQAKECLGPPELEEAGRTRP